MQICYLYVPVTQGYFWNLTATSSSLDKLLFCQLHILSWQVTRVLLCFLHTPLLIEINTISAVSSALQPLQSAFSTRWMFFSFALKLACPVKDCVSQWFVSHLVPKTVLRPRRYRKVSPPLSLSYQLHCHPTTVFALICFLLYNPLLLPCHLVIKFTLHLSDHFGSYQLLTWGHRVISRCSLIYQYELHL